MTEEDALLILGSSSTAVPQLPPSTDSQPNVNAHKSEPEQQDKSEPEQQHKSEPTQTGPADSVRRSDRKRQEPTRYPDKEPKKEEV